MISPLDPQKDIGWRELLARNSQASVFHTPEWLFALNRTYGYEPIIFSANADGRELTNGILFCRVKSWLTGSRLVSLPFSDHCQPLGSSADIRAVLQLLAVEREANKWSYAECRPLMDEYFARTDENGFEPVTKFHFHQIDLSPSLKEIFHNFHKDCIQRKIRRAEREGLRYERGRSRAILEEFYGLMLKTRKRQGLPPQPRDWFKNLADSMGEALKIRIVKKAETPVAGILTLSFKDSVVYKYGCSDVKLNNLGGTSFLFWQLIQEAKAEGRKVLDLGRSDLHNSGLVAFKDHLGARKSSLTYYRNPSQVLIQHSGWKEKARAQVFRRMPTPCLAIAGRLFYKHVG